MYNNIVPFVQFHVVYIGIADKSVPATTDYSSSSSYQIIQYRT